MRLLCFVSLIMTGQSDSQIPSSNVKLAFDMNIGIAGFLNEDMYIKAVLASLAGVVR